MSDDEQLSDEELDDLLSDLETRSEDGGEGDFTGEMPEGEELEALFEEEPSGEAAAETKVADRQKPDAEVGPDLSDLDVADELPAESGGTAAEQSENTGQQTNSEPDSAAPQTEPTKSDEDSGKTTTEQQTGASTVWPYVWLTAKWAAYGLPVLAFWWVLGAYLAQWISAGWLIAVVCTMFAVALPKAMYDAADRRGRFRWWIAGASVVLTTALVAPMPDAAGTVLTQYGHWPATTVAEITGVQGGWFVEANAAAGEWLGRSLHPELPAGEGMHPLGD